VKRALSDFDWTDLNTFLQTARKGTAVAAGEQLPLDVTTVRRRLAALEAAVGIRLFMKNGRSLQLTPDGERVYSIASRMEELSSEIVRGATDAARELVGVVRVSSMEAFGSFFLAPRLSKFVGQHPQLSVQLVSSPHILSLADREADISINMVCPQRGRLVVRKVGQFSVGLFGAPRYLKAAGTPKTLRDLSDHTFITYVDELISVPQVRWLLDVIENPKTRFACTSLVAQFKATCAGSGLAMLPHFMAGNEEPLVRVMEAEIHIVRDWWLVVHQDLQSVPRIRAVIDFITDVMRRDYDVLMSGCAST
jgi:DNA-binding transcriptional LysR family regulator